MSENKKKNVNNASETTSFDKLIESIKTNYLNNGDWQAPLYELSIACAYSVCNKIQFTGYTDKIRQLKQSIAFGLSLLSDDVSDDKKVSDIVGDGVDLVHSAFAMGLELCELHNGDLKSEYTITRVSKKVWYTDPEICKPKEEQTSGVREMYRAARRYIQDNRAVSYDAANRHQYIEYNYSELSDNEDELSDYMEDYVIYRRMSTTYSGTDIALTDAIASDRGDADTIDTMIDSIGLSEKEEKILRYRLRGYSEKATAKALGLTRDSVHGAMLRIRDKAKKMPFKNYRE